MAFEHRDNSASVFRNEHKESPNQPDFKGSGKIDGKEYYVSMWTKPPADGKKGFFSIALTLKEEVNPGEMGFKKYNPDEFDDDIPF